MTHKRNALEAAVIARIKAKEATVVARMPGALLRKIDAAAARADRSRAAEVRYRLEQSFAPAVECVAVPR